MGDFESACVGKLILSGFNSSILSSSECYVSFMEN